MISSFSFIESNCDEMCDIFFNALELLERTDRTIDIENYPIID